MFESLTEILDDLGKQKEAIILDQLGDMLKRGLLIVESTQPVLIKDEFSDKITLKQSIRLTLRDKEYIEKLEKENAEYKDLIERLNKALDRQLI